MTESRIDATHRLVREGRWEEASRYRQEVRLQYRAQKMKRPEAVEASWQAMLAKYPPVGQLQYQTVVDAVAVGLTDEADSEMVKRILESEAGGPVDLVRDINWVYSRLAVGAVDASDVPSLGAWSLLRWARDDSNRFFEQLLPKAMAVRNKQEESDEINRKEAERIAELQRDLDKLHEEWDEELREDPPAKIREATLGRLADFERWFGLSLPGGAAEALAGRMAGYCYNTT